MARGFGTTFGTASTDRIVSSYTTHGTTRSYAIWFNFHATTNNRIWCKQISGGTQIEQFITTSGGATHTYLRSWSGGDNSWTAPTPASFIDVWHHWVVTYDGGNVNNDPLIYLDGVSQTVTQAAGPTSGTIVTNTSGYHIGNRGAADRVADGLCAEFAIWDRIITQTEVTALAAGLSPRFLATSLVEYIPMSDSTVTSWVGLTAPTVTGALSQTHRPTTYSHTRRNGELGMGYGMGHGMPVD